MPAIPLYFDLTSRVFADIKGTLSSAPLIGKQGDVNHYELSLFANGVLTDLECSSLRIGIKDPANLSSAYLAECFGVKSGSANYAKWLFELDLSSSAIGTFLTATPSGIANLELEVLTDDDRITSPLTPFTISPTMGRDTYLFCAGTGYASVYGFGVYIPWFSVRTGVITVRGGGAIMAFE